MKQTNCKNLRGPCDENITGENVDEMAANGKNHVMQKVMSGDPAHTAAANDMMALSKEDQQKWYQEFVDTFESLPEKA